MIRVYQPPTKKNPTLGMSFEYFKTMKIGIHHMRYSDLPTAIFNFELAKRDVIVHNLEAFWHFCYENIAPGSQVYPDAMRSLRDTVQMAGENQLNYDEVLAETIEKANFMRTLVKGVTHDKDERNRAVMMASCILKFCKDELDERKKDTNKEEHSP